MIPLLQINEIDDGDSEERAVVELHLQSSTVASFDFGEVGSAAVLSRVALFERSLRAAIIRATPLTAPPPPTHPPPPPPPHRHRHHRRHRHRHRHHHHVPMHSLP